MKKIKIKRSWLYNKKKNHIGEERTQEWSSLKVFLLEKKLLLFKLSKKSSLSHFLMKKTRSVLNLAKNQNIGYVTQDKNLSQTYVTAGIVSTANTAKKNRGLNVVESIVPGSRGKWRNRCTYTFKVSFFHWNGP